MMVLYLTRTSKAAIIANQRQKIVYFFSAGVTKVAYLLTLFSPNLANVRKDTDFRQIRIVIKFIKVETGAKLQNTRRLM